MDIYCQNDKFSFHIRSAGIIIKNNKVMLQHEKDGCEYALPGGTLKLGETTEENLIREWKEETGSDIEIQRLLWIEENFWEYKEKTNHGIVFYYLINLCNGTDIPDNDEFISQKDNCNIFLEWVALDKIKDLILYPAFAKEELLSLCETTKHFISRE